MDSKYKICMLVCCFAAAREFRPVEPFITDYLTSPEVGFTTETVVEYIFAIGTYSSFALIVVIFLITDYLKYKSIIIADGIAGIMAYVLLLWKPSIQRMQIEQFFFAFFYSADVAYYTYMYAKIEDKDVYSKITGYVRASVLFGKFLSGMTAQILVLTSDVFNEHYLVYMSIAGMVVTTILGIMFPPVENTVYFHQKKDFPSKDIPNYGISSTQLNLSQITVNESNVSTEHLRPKPKSKFRIAMFHIWSDFRCSFKNRTVIKWSIWWVLAGAGYYLVLTYCQVIWRETLDFNKSDMKSYNGIVDCIGTLLGAVASFWVGRLDCNWTERSGMLLGVGSIITGIIVSFTSLLYNLWLLYLLHILFEILYHTMLTVAEFEIAKYLKESCYGLAFGFISFLTLALTSVWTVLIVQDTFFTFDIRKQFEFTAIYFMAIGIFFLLQTIKCLRCL